MKKNLILSLTVGLVLATAMGAEAQTKKYKASKSDSAKVYKAWTKSNMDPGWMDKSKAPNKKSGNASGEKDRSAGKTKMSIGTPLNGDGSWSITISNQSALTFMGKKTDRNRTLTISYNAASQQLVVTGELNYEISKTVDLPVWPGIVAKVGGGAGVTLSGSTSVSGGGTSGGLTMKPYATFSGGVGVGIPFINASANINTEVYVKFNLTFGTSSGVGTKRAAGFDVTLVAQVQVFIVIWQQDWHLAGYEKEF